MPQSLQGHTPVTSWDEIIKKLAEQEGVNPSLALAVAQRESTLRPDAVGDGGKALGFFQLHAGAAQDTGVDRTDPVQNILGGVRYLKQLQTRYADVNGHADLSRVLQAYNGGMDNVDKGTVSLDAQKYAQEIINGLVKVGPKATPAPATPPPANAAQDLLGAQDRLQQGGGNAQTIGAAPGYIESARRLLVAGGRKVVESYNPLTSEGRVNLAGTAASLAASYYTGGLSRPVLGAALPWIQRSGIKQSISRVLAPAFGAAAGGGAAAAGNAVLEGRAPTSREVGGAAFEQGLTDAGGSMIVGAGRRLAKSAMAAPIGRAAKDAFETQLATLKTTGRAAMDLADDTIRGIRDAGSATVDALKTQASSIDDILATGRAQGAATTPSPNAIAPSGYASSPIRAANERYQALVHPPSVIALEGAVRDVLSGYPGIKGEKGAAVRALNETGENVKRAALAGPMLDLTVVRSRATQLARQLFPRMMDRPTKEAAELTGRIDELQQLLPTSPGARAAAEQGQIGQEIRSFSEELARIEQTQPPDLPGLLGLLSRTPDELISQVPFADAHKLKLLLDDGVKSWDDPAKKTLDRATKGLRNTLRSVMNTPEYNAATAAYEREIKLYTRGRGRDLINAIAKGKPDGLAKMLNEDQPIAAGQIRSLLVDQSGKGGDLDGGEHAWGQLRDHFTFNRVIAGGANGLPDRLRSLLDKPDFVRAVYGDAAGKAYLDNLGQIVNSIELAQEFMKVEGQLVQQQIKDTIAATQRDVTTAQLAKRTTKRANQAAQEATVKQGQDLRQSSLQKAIYGFGSSPQDVSDVTKLAFFGVKSKLGVWGGIRLFLNNPKNEDIIRYAAQSGPKTQMFIRALFSQGNDRGMASLIRIASGGRVDPPVTGDTDARSQPR